MHRELVVEQFDLLGTELERHALRWTQLELVERPSRVVLQPAHDVEPQLGFRIAVHTVGAHHVERDPATVARDILELPERLSPKPTLAKELPCDVDGVIGPVFHVVGRDDATEVIEEIDAFLGVQQRRVRRIVLVVLLDRLWRVPQLAVGCLSEGLEDAANAVRRSDRALDPEEQVDHVGAVLLEDLQQRIVGDLAGHDPQGERQDAQVDVFVVGERV
jgi:hypothetical protein